MVELYFNFKLPPEKVYKYFQLFCIIKTCNGSYEMMYISDKGIIYLQKKNSVDYCEM